MSNTMSKDEAMRKVKGLLKLVGTANENEAAAAVQAAQKLMQKYQFKADEAEKYGEIVPEKVEKQVLCFFNKKKIQEWKGRLAQGIAENNFCTVSYGDAVVETKTETRNYNGTEKEYSYPVYNACMHVYGKPSHIEANRAMMDYLVAVCERLSAEAITEYKKTYNPEKRVTVVVKNTYWGYDEKEGRQTAHSFADNFRKGFANAVSSRLRKQKEDAMQNGINFVNQEKDEAASFDENYSEQVEEDLEINEEITALAVRDMYEKAKTDIEKWYTDKGIKFGKRAASKGTYKADGYRLGQAAGNKVSLGGNQLASTGKATRMLTGG